jgi:hypothetical protein
MAAAQDRDGGSRSIVDYTFDVPLTLAAELTGYQHDWATFAWGAPHFTALARSRQDCSLLPPARRERAMAPGRPGQAGAITDVKP